MAAVAQPVAVAATAGLAVARLVTDDSGTVGLATAGLAVARLVTVGLAADAAGASGASTLPTPAGAEPAAAFTAAAGSGSAAAAGSGSASAGDASSVVAAADLGVVLEPVSPLPDPAAAEPLTVAARATGLGAVESCTPKPDPGETGATGAGAGADALGVAGASVLGESTRAVSWGVKPSTSLTARLR